ncbi:hypothetical protein AeMF1_017900 [Aphanomyces euteiches]|nr:hypothetical protein AeMF1_017900 [Aphanomyces euteiches]
MQTTPDVALLGHLPDSQDQIQLDSVPSMPLMDLLNGSLGADSLSAPKADVEVKKSVTQLTALPGVHSHINRLLNRICKPAGVEAELTSHSFRRGGAQHANSSAELSPQWIFDRGSWNMTATNKAFAYVFNTSNEDQKVARVLSSWPASANVMGPTLDALDAATRVDVSRLQERLFTACVSMQEKKFNISGEVATFLMGYLLRSYPMFKALCSTAPLVIKIENAARLAQIDVEALIAWGTLLRNRKMQPTDASEKANLNKYAEQQTDMIEVLTEQNKRLLDRIKLIEAELASSSNAAKEAVVERVVKRDAAAIHSTSNKPAKKRRGESIMPSTMWFEWFTLEPRPWSQVDHHNHQSRQRRSDMKLLVDFMRLFINGGYRLHENSAGYRDDALTLGRTAESNMILFLQGKGIRAKAGGACLKHLRELHSAGALNAHIKQFDLLFRARLIEDPSPSSTINKLQLY